MFHHAVSVKALENYIISVEFFDGTVKEFDVSNLFERFPLFRELEKDPELFKKAHLDSAGWGIIWNDKIDLSSSTVWEKGETVRKNNRSFKIKMANAVLEARELRGIYQNDLSKMSGISQADISRIETGTSNPSVKTLERLFEAMDVDVEITVKSRQG